MTPWKDPVRPPFEGKKRIVKGKRKCLLINLKKIADAHGQRSEANGRIQEPFSFLERRPR